MSLTVLLVEDDRELRATLRQALQVEGWLVLACASLADARAVIAQALQPTAAGLDIVLLDLNLPDGAGDSLLADLRRHPATPVIVISARPGAEERARLLDAGADDFLLKPFNLAELLARMRVALRHRGTLVHAPQLQYARAGVVIDLHTRQVHRDNIDVHLTPTEYKLLARLVRQAGQVVTHRQLLTDVWGAEFTDHTHYLRLYMGQLRAKLEAEPADPRVLLTEPGIGYRLAESQVWA